MPTVSGIVAVIAVGGTKGSVMEILNPVDDLDESLKYLAEKGKAESGSPQTLSDPPEQLAKMLGRQRVTYDPVWLAVERASPKWVPVRCNSYRRALLLASSAIQHRTNAYEVWRRGRLVCIRKLQEGVLKEILKEDTA